jgi:hypothetical protein
MGSGSYYAAGKLLAERYNVINNYMKDSDDEPKNNRAINPSFDPKTYLSKSAVLDYMSADKIGEMNLKAAERDAYIKSRIVPYGKKASNYLN